MNWNLIWENLINSAIFAVLGILIFSIAFWVIRKCVSFSFKHELIEEHNTALAIVIGAMSLGLCIIIAAAIH